DTITQQVVVSGTVGSPLTPEGGTVRVYPNPASNEIKIQSEKHKIQNITLYDIAGKKVPLAGGLERVRRGQGDEITLDINSLPVGLYFIQINLSNGTTERLRFIKQ